MDTEADTLSGVKPIAYPVDSTEPMSLEDAVRDLGAAREKALNPTAESAEEPATAETESSVEGDAAVDEDQPTGETQEADPAEEPLLELPRSWAKEQLEHWKALPRALQEVAIAQASKDSEAVRNAQNKAADAAKAAEAKAAEAEQVRQQFEAKIATAQQVLEREQLRDFPDIKTMADVERMALEDPFRKIQWDVHQQKMQAVAWENQQAEQRKSQQHQTEWTTHVHTENARAAELIPELADKVKGPALMTKAADRLAELGFKPEELNDLASGKQKLSIYDHRLQQLIFSDLKLKDIQGAPRAVASKPLPTVVRPGTAKPAIAGVQASIQALEKQQQNATGDRAVEIATQIYQLEQKAARR